jgi:methyl-accepting chemotaxis protein
MKINMPITNNEVVMKPNTILVTRTDLKGMITFANDAFVEISGYTRDELVGSSHNIVRHPEMPAAAFDDMWRTLKQNRPWQGMVKNRTKSGDFYWVNANAMPLFENNAVKGYLSVRLTPSRAEIDAANQLYRKVNAKEATLNPTGLAAIHKFVSEISLGKKMAFAGALLMLPNLMLLRELLESESYLLISALAVTTFAAFGIMAHVTQSTRHFFTSAIHELFRLSVNEFSPPLNLTRNDQFGDLFRGIYVAGVKLGDDIAQAKQTNSNSLRIIQGLKYAECSILITNANSDIIFVNQAAEQLFLRAQKDIQTVIPNFDVQKLLGAQIDIFHNVPALQKTALAALNDSKTSQFDLAGHTMQLTVKPVFEINGDRIGYVAEWLDRTTEVKIEGEIEHLVSAIKQGDLGKRIDLKDKNGFMKSLSTNINDLTDVIENVFNDINYIIEKLAEGDLTNNIHSDYEGIYAQCKDNMNDAISKISEFILQIREAADFVNTSSQEMASGNNNLSNRVEQQAASLEETAASMQELSSTVISNAENTKTATVVVKSAAEVAEKGGEVVKSAIAAMQAINESSNRIAEIIGVIDEIAFQTNLLALNASVEAARAGEQGLGFSVVATEVRNLAQRSATAAKQSNELIQNSVQEVRSGTAFVNETGAALMEIVDSIIHVGTIVGHITAASNEQSAGISQVNQAVSQMDDITQQNAALAEEAAAGSMAMSEQSAKMTHLLNFFKVNGKSPAAYSAQATLATSKPAANKQSAAKSKVAVNANFDEWEEF